MSVELKKRRKGKGKEEKTATLVESRAKAQGRGDPTALGLSRRFLGPHDNEHGIGGDIVRVMDEESTLLGLAKEYSISLWRWKYNNDEERGRKGKWCGMR